MYLSKQTVLPQGFLSGSKSNAKTDPKRMPKSSQIQTAQNRSGATPADVSELDRRQPDLDEGAQKSYQKAYPRD